MVADGHYRKMATERWQLKPLLMLVCDQVYSNAPRPARVPLVGLGCMASFKVVQNEELINFKQNNSTSSRTKSDCRIL